MEQKIAASTIGLAIVLTVVAGLFRGCIFGGLISMDPSVWSGCGWIQGLVTGLVLVLFTVAFALMQCVVLGALLWRAPWRRPQDLFWHLSICVVACFRLQLCCLLCSFAVQRHLSRENHRVWISRRDVLQCSVHGVR